MKKEYNLIKIYYKTKKEEKKWSKGTKITISLYVALISVFVGVYWMQIHEYTTLNEKLEVMKVYIGDDANQKRYEEITTMTEKKQMIDIAIEEIDRINLINQERPVFKESAFRTLLQPDIDIHSIKWNESAFQVEMQSKSNKIPSDFSKWCQDSLEFEKVDYFGFKYKSDSNLYISTFEFLLKGGQAND